MHLIRAHLKISRALLGGLLMMIMQYLFLIVFIKAYAVGTHLNCLNKEAIQRSTHNIRFYKKVDTKTLAVT